MLRTVINHIIWIIFGLWATPIVVFVALLAGIDTLVSWVQRDYDGLNEIREIYGDGLKRLWDYYVDVWNQI